MSKLNWTTFHGDGKRYSYAARFDGGQYTIDPKPKRGYYVQVANQGGLMNMPHSGLWHEIGSFSSPQLAKSEAQKHFDAHDAKRKANPAPRKRAAKRVPSLYGAKMKHLESALSALNMLIDKGAEFPDAVIKVSESTGVDIEVLTAEYDNYWRAWSELSSAYRKTNPAKRPAPKKPVKGYFPNPGKDEFLVQVCSPISVPLASRKWTTVLKFKTEKEAKETALQMARIDRLDRSWRVMKK